MINLIDNAIKFTSSGYVRVRFSTDTGSDEELLSVAVEDTGSGISTSDQSKLFQPFEQFSGEQKGTGLGLAISQKYAELMGGRIHVDSQLGQGSRFTLTIPIRRSSGDHCSSDTQQGRVSSLSCSEQPPRILIVDDDQLNSHMLHQFLSSIGFETRIGTHDEACSLFNTWNPHATLIDRCMPEKHHLEITRQIGAIAKGDDAIIIMVDTGAFATEQQYILAADESVPVPGSNLGEEILKVLGQFLELDYEYKSQERSGLLLKQKSDSIRDSKIVTVELNPELLSGLTTGQIESLHDVVLRGDLEQFISIVENLNKLAADSKRALLKLARAYQYDHLQELLKKTVV